MANPENLRRMAERLLSAAVKSPTASRQLANGKIEGFSRPDSSRRRLDRVIHRAA
jgi:hypothetical protein